RHDPRLHRARRPGPDAPPGWLARRLRRLEPAYEGQPGRGARPVHLPRRIARPAGFDWQVRGGEVMRARVFTRSRRWTLALAFLFAAGLSAPRVHAQTKTGTTFGAFTLIEPDARLAAMGNAGSAAGEGLAGAHRFSLRFAAAAQVNYLEETIFHTSAGTITFSGGTLYRMSADGLRIGASLANFGTRAAFSGNDLAIAYDNVSGQNGDNPALPGARDTDPFSVPITFRVGVAQPFVLGHEARLLLAADALHPSDNTESLS